MERRLITNGYFASFEQLISSNKIYVDKTKFACELAKDEGAFLLTRPRRMGKSTMVSTLEYLFSKGTVGTEGLYCHEHWPDPNRYFVFHLDWSRSDISSVDDFKKSLNDYLDGWALYFGFEIPTNKILDWRFVFFFQACIAKLKDEEFLAAHPELKEGDRPFCSDRVVLLIDEYDAPLSRNLDNPELFEQLLPIYTSFFSTIKSLRCFRLVFITGVSSYSQTSIFSGANQFINISLDSDYATCCGYTREEIEHYFAPELKRAQEVTNLSHDELLKAMSYFYDGYSFSKKPEEQTRVFSPVSVSLFLREPEEGFNNYWSNTGAQSSFILKMLQQCNHAIVNQLLNSIYQNSIDKKTEVDASIAEAIEGLFPVFSLAIDKSETNQANKHLLSIDVNSLIVKHDDIKALSLDNAIAILFQGGYLSIKEIIDNDAYLGLANHEVANSLATLLMQELKKVHPELSGINHKLFSLLSNKKEVFERLHQGGKGIADLFSNIFNSFDQKIFKEPNYEEVLSSIIGFSMMCTGFYAQREVASLFGYADFVIYKKVNGLKVPDVIIEFKLARCRQNIIKKLNEGSKQMVDRKYGFSLLNSDPHRYCIVISNALKQVAAVSRINRDGTYAVEYQHPDINTRGIAKPK
ncbi:AAA family ATPase [Anaerobiospirillum succiniciproducens]|uniref:AAA family ATPase n=1 Tax=Anaerobiospirillum succiniciproducens TaxID=13335 RepID=UPI00042490C0|nr:AAA family ATPase [Anaerobiospirillum succiniciproducens]